MENLKDLPRFLPMFRFIFDVVHKSIAGDFWASDIAENFKC